jgi:ornithine decarboxylase
MVQAFSGAAALLAIRNPVDPVLCLRPRVLAATARRIVDAFPGDVLYAVKCNDQPLVLESLWAGGVHQFDTASIAEVRLVRERLPDAACHFMHPVKSPEAIAEAYHRHGVRRFVFDHADELDKIAEATAGADDLELFLRLSVPGDGAVLTLTGKFGVDVGQAPGLLRAARGRARAVGLTFHVGSQCVDTAAFARAIALAAAVVREAGPVGHLDVGGGFPAAYQGHEPSFEAFVRTIQLEARRHRLACRLQCEPGRALVAAGASVLARVELRRGRALYLNDGVYGNLAELKWIGPHFPMRVVRDGARAVEHEAFDLFGPTCDSIDSMPGPHWLPVDTAEGEWLEIGMMGAYSNALKTRFNGFASAEPAVLDDAPWYLGAANAKPAGERLTARAA